MGGILTLLINPALLQFLDLLLERPHLAEQLVFAGELALLAAACLGLVALLVQRLELGRLGEALLDRGALRTHVAKGDLGGEGVSHIVHVSGIQAEGKPFRATSLASDKLVGHRCEAPPIFVRKLCRMRPLAEHVAGSCPGDGTIGGTIR